MTEEEPINVGKEEESEEEEEEGDGIDYSAYEQPPKPFYDTIPGSTVPLAGIGTLPGEPTEQEIETMKQEMRVRMQMEQQEHVREQRPNYADIRKARADKIVSGQMREAKDHFKSEGQRASAERKIQREAEQAGLLDENVMKCTQKANLLNRYRGAYKGKIPFQFKVNYTYDMELAMLESHLETVRSMIDMTDVPSAVAAMMVKFAEIIELSSILISDRFEIDLDLSGIGEDTTVAIEGGAFTAEITQASVELSEMFRMPYYVRGVMKFSSIAHRRWEINRRKKYGKGPGPNFDEVKLSREQTDDL